MPRSVRSPVRRSALLAAAGATGLGAVGAPLSAQAQAAWPNRPIKWIVPYPPGGQTDIVSRYLAEKLSTALGQPVVVENRAGAQGIVGITAAKQAAPDGYTFVYINSSNYCINMFAYTKLSYSQDDFDPVSQLGEAALGMVVSSSSGIKSLDEYIAFVRKNPGKTTYGSFGNGSSSHLYAEMFTQLAKLDTVHVAYKGAGPAIQDVMAGQATMGVHDFATTGPFINGGRLTLLAVTGRNRWPTFPDAKTFAEQGYPALDLVGWNGVVTPKGSPKAATERMSAEIMKIIHSPEGKKRILDLGLLPTGTTPAAFNDIIKKDTPRWGEVFKASGVKPE
jgi:tripartite-type tricarboxylate transporter receptor subunit TctC